MSTQLLLHLNGPDGVRVAADVARRHVTQFGDAAFLSQDEAKFGLSSLRLADTPDSYLAVRPIVNPADVRGQATSLDVMPGTPPFTVEGWFRMTAVPVFPQRWILIWRGGAPNSGAGQTGWHIRVNSNSLSFHSCINQSDIGQTQVQALSISWAVDTWYHFFFGRRSDGQFHGGVGASGTPSIFAVNNPTSIFSNPPGPGPNPDGLFDLVIGNVDPSISPPTADDQPFRGFVDEVRWSDEQIYPDTGTYTVPTAAFTPLEITDVESSVQASDLVVAASRPSLASDVWEPAHWFRHNWEGNGISQAIAFATSVTEARTTAEKRTALIDRPQRTFKVRHTTLERRLTRLLIDQAYRWGDSRTLLQLHSDRTKTSAAASSGQPTIACDTTDRRFYVGQRVLLAAGTDRTMLTGPEVRQVLSLTDTSITFVNNLAADLPKGAFVYPLLEAKVMLQSDRERITGHIADAEFDFTEVEGRSALPPLAALDSISAGMDSYEGYPIFDFKVQDATEISARSGFQTVVGRSTWETIQGERAKRGVRGDLRFLNRAEAFRYLRFFHSRGGRACPFWAMSHFSEYVVEQVTSTSIRVTAEGDVNDWAYAPFIGVLLRDGSIVVREISQVSRSVDQDILQFLDPVTFSDTDVVRAGRASLVRMNSDEVGEDWKTDTIMETEFEYLETMEEKLLSAGIEIDYVSADEVLTERIEVDCDDDCIDSDSECDPLHDATPGADGEGG